MKRKRPVTDNPERSVKTAGDLWKLDINVASKGPLLGRPSFEAEILVLVE